MTISRNRLSDRRHSTHCKFATIISATFALVVAAASPALARPRDAVLSAAYGCAVIANSQQWLDCYYGAAQPARAALGLKGALAAQIELARLPPSGNAPAQNLDTRDLVMSRASHCQSVAEERGWLDCYYAAAQPMRALLGLLPAPQSEAAAARPYNRPEPVPTFAGRAPIRYGTFPMTSYSFDKMGLFSVTLANGQRWRQLAGDTDRAHWRLAPTSYPVSITHGFMGSYNLQIKDIAGRYKVAPVP